MAPGAAKEVLGGAGGGRVVAQRDRIAAYGRDFARDVEFAPVGHGAGGRANLGLPGPHLEWRRDAEPRDLAALRLVQRIKERGLLLAHETENHRRRRKGEGAAGAPTDRPAEIDENEIATPPADLEAERVGAVGIERHRYRGLADAAAQRRLALQQAVRLQPIHDRRSRL